jgi:hypothetical protein
MPDDADITQARAEAEAALFAKRKREPGLLAIGACYFCSSSIPNPHLFCDSYCRDDYEREQRAQRRNGIRA